MQSTILTISIQSAGRAYVRERHTDAIGRIHYIEYLANAGTDTDELLSLHATHLAEALTQGEIEQNATDSNSATFNYCTVTQFRQSMRERFKSATKIEAVLIGNWFNLNMTDAELKLTFGLNTAQTTALRSKLQQATTLYNQIQTAGGQ